MVRMLLGTSDLHLLQKVVQKAAWQQIHTTVVHPLAQLLAIIAALDLQLVLIGPPMLKLST